MIPPELVSQVSDAQAVAPRMAQLRKSSQAMEAHFLKDMLQAMKKTVPKTKLGDDFGSDEYQDMFDEAVSTAMSKKTNFGIAETVYRSLEPRAFHEELTRIAAKAAAAKSGTADGDKS